MRIDHLNTFAYVIQTTPNPIPYLNGKTYLPFITTFVPRLIWPDKPIYNVNRLYGLRYNLINKLEPKMTWALPVFTEGWVNHGILGFFLSAVLIGLILAFIWHVIITNTNSVGNMLLAATTVYFASRGESNTYIMLANTIKFLIVIYILEWFVRKLVLWYNKNNN